MSCKSLNETFDISVKTLENPIFPTIIKSSLLPRPECFESRRLLRPDRFESSLLPRPECFESSLLPRLVCFVVTKMVFPFMTTINNIYSLLHRVRECITK